VIRASHAGAALLGLLLLQPPAALADFEAGLAAADRGDYEAAMAEWIPLAADGVASAQYNVALLYLNAWGVQRDAWEALTWFWQAAEQGHADAQYAIGTMYEEGIDMPVDLAHAYAWYAVAARSGHSEAPASRDATLATLPSDERPVARQLADELWTRYGRH
jgi:TPR repeat protein